MNLFQRVSAYFKGITSELRKVTWPTLPIVTRYFISVVAGIALATVFVGGVDYLFIKGLSLIVK